MENLLFLTELQGLAVFDLKGGRIGRIRDAGLVPRSHPVRVDRFLVGAGSTWLTVRHDQIRSISLSGIHLRCEQLTPYHDDEYMLRVVRDLLDQQIIDAGGNKVVRVSDVSFKITRENDCDVLMVQDIDIGMRSVLRRVLQGVVPRRVVRFLQRPIPPKSIRWEYCNIIEPDPQRRLRLNISQEQIEAIHPADLADIVEDLPPGQRGVILEAIDSGVAADALSEIEPEIQAKIVESLDPEKAAEILEEMAPDEAADLLAEIKQETSEEILDEMSPEVKTEFQELLEFDESTAGALMNTEFLALKADATVADALATLRRSEDLLDGLTVLYLIDAEGRLVGSVPLTRLLLAKSDTLLAGLAPDTSIRSNVNDHRDRVIELFDKYNLLALPVVDENGRMAGVITADDVITVLRPR